MNLPMPFYVMTFMSVGPYVFSSSKPVIDFHFVPYWSILTSTLHEAQFELI